MRTHAFETPGRSAAKLVEKTRNSTTATPYQEWRALAKDSGLAGGSSGRCNGRRRRNGRFISRHRLGMAAVASQIVLLLTGAFEIGFIPAAAGQSKRRRADHVVQVGCSATGANGGISVRHLLQMIKMMAASAAFKLVNRHKNSNSLATAGPTNVHYRCVLANFNALPDTCRRQTCRTTCALKRTHGQIASH